MKIDSVDVIERAASALADADGLRTGCEAVAAHITRVLGGQFAFVARARSDGGIADILAANGLGAADFRRLESRLAKSSLWKIIPLSSPFVIDDLASDVVLNFLAFGTGARLLAAVPIVVCGTTAGFIAVAFPAGSDVLEEEIIKLLKVLSALVAQAMRVDRNVKEESRKLLEENSHLKQ